MIRRTRIVCVNLFSTLCVSSAIALVAIAQQATTSSADKSAPSIDLATMSKSLPVDDLLAQVKQSTTDLDAWTGDEKIFAERADSIKDEAHTLAAIAVILAMHDQEHPLKPNNGLGLLLVGAQAVSKAKDRAAALAGVEQIKLAQSADRPASPPATIAPAKVASLGRLMNRVAATNSKLRNALRRLDPRRADENARHATTLAAIGQAIVFDTHEVKNPADLPKWFAMSNEMRDAFAELSRAIRAGDKDAATTASTRVQKNCDACHEVFHNE